MTDAESLSQVDRGFSDMSLKAYKDAVRDLNVSPGLWGDASIEAVDAALDTLPDESMVSEATAAHFMRVSGKTMVRDRKARISAILKPREQDETAIVGPPFHHLPTGGYGYRMGDLRQAMMDRPFKRKLSASKAALKREEDKRRSKTTKLKSLSQKLGSRSLESKLHDYIDKSEWPDLHIMLVNHKGAIIGFVELHPYSTEHIAEALAEGAMIVEMTLYEAIFEATWVDSEVRRPWQEFAEVILQDGIAMLKSAQESLRAKGLLIELDSTIPQGLSAPKKPPL